MIEDSKTLLTLRGILSRWSLEHQRQCPACFAYARYAATTPCERGAAVGQVWTALTKAIDLLGVEPAPDSGKKR